MRCSHQEHEEIHHCSILELTRSGLLVFGYSIISQRVPLKAWSYILYILSALLQVDG